MRIKNEYNNTIMLENETIRKVADFIYLGSNVSEDGGAIKDVNIRIQKARAAFSRLRKIWKLTQIHKSTNIKIFNSCVKSVLLYRCDTWLVSTDIQIKLQSFISRCLRYICRIWWPRVVSKETLWKETNQENVNTGIRWLKFRWIGHIFSLFSSRTSMEHHAHFTLETTGLGNTIPSMLPAKSWRE
jgi:hypothetical protein